MVTHHTLLAAYYFGYLMIGFIITIAGPVIPPMREEFGLSLGQVGPMFFVQSAGFALAIMAGGVASDVVGRRPVLLWGALLLGVGLLGFLIPGNWTLALICFFVTGLGLGFSEGSLNSIVVDISEGDEGRALNILHLFPAIGSIAGPFASKYFAAFSWRYSFAAIGVGALIFFLWIYGMPAHIDGRAATNERKRPGGLFSPQMRHPFVLMLIVTASLYLGASQGITGWVVTYAHRVFMTDTAFGVGVTSLFWVGITAGRWMSGQIAGKVQLLPLVILLGSGAFLAGLGIIAATSPTVFASFIFISGLFFGGIFPSIVAQASISFPNQVGTVTGFIIATATAGGAFFPAFLGAVGERFGMLAGFSTVLIVLLFMVISAAWAHALDRQRNQRIPPEYVDL